jgi:hypothetical protein
MISSPEGRVDADQVVQKVPLELSERIFSTNQIILSGKGIDIIQGMSWMKAHRAVLDIAGRLVHLDSPVYGKVILHLPAISRIKASLHHMVELELEDIHIIREYPYVFPDELPRMPPERAIEFKIELQPGTTPVAKAPYKMSPVEMKEFKVQCKDYWTRVIFSQAHHPGLFSVVCGEERQRAASMCGLPTAQCSHHQEQVSTSTH